MAGPRTRAALLLGGVLLGWPAVSNAQGSDPAQLPSAERILAHYQSFLGGAAALSRVNNRTTRSRRVERSATPSDDILLRYSKSPVLSIMQHKALDGSFIRYMNGCDETGGWVGYPGPHDDGTPRSGRGPTDGVCAQEQYYYGYLPLDMSRLKQNVQRFEVRAAVRIVTPDPTPLGGLAGGHGKDLVPAGPREAYLVLSVPTQNTDQYVWLYFDSQTGALLRRADAGLGPTPVPPGENPRSTDFLQYREVGDGTRAPFQFVTTSPGSEVRAVAVDVTDNTTLADDLFVRPKDVRRLDKGLAGAGGSPDARSPS